MSAHRPPTVPRSATRPSPDEPDAPAEQAHPHGHPVESDEGRASAGTRSDRASSLVPRHVPEVLFLARDADDERRGADLVRALGGCFDGRSARLDRMAPSDLEDAHLVFAWSWEPLAELPHRLEMLARARPKLAAGWTWPGGTGAGWTERDAEQRGELALLRRVPRAVVTFDADSERLLRPHLLGTDGLPPPEGGDGLSACLPIGVDASFFSPGALRAGGVRPLRVGWDDRAEVAPPVEGIAGRFVQWIPIWQAARSGSPLARRDLFRTLDAVCHLDRGGRPTWVEEAAACGVLPVTLGSDQEECPFAVAPAPVRREDGFAHPRRTVWTTARTAETAFAALATEPSRRAEMAASVRAWMGTHGSWDVRAAPWGRLFRRLLTPESHHVTDRRQTLAIAAETAADLPVALRHWHRVLTARPLSIAAHDGLARVYRRMGQSETAFAFAQRSQALATPAPARRGGTARLRPSMRPV